MKKIYWIAFLSILSFSASAQKPKTTAADGLYKQFRFQEAAQAYEKALRGDTTHLEILQKLVHCYTRLNHTDKAEYWLRKVVNHAGAQPAHFKQLASLMSGNGRYKEATHWFNKSYESTLDPESLRWLQAYKNMPAFYEDSALYQIRKPGFNSSQSDFSPAFYEGGLVFCSARQKKETGKESYQDPYSKFIDLYYVSDSVSKPEIFSSRLNSSYHEGPVATTPNQDTLYFTRSNFLKKQLFSSEGVNKLKIYYAAVQNGQWNGIQEFELNDNEYSVGHPTLAGSHLMYFSSDMPGGLGGTDLYKTEKVNGVWQKPVNLGPKINTSGNEMFPFIDQEGHLYFASSGHPGLGGLDLFRASPTKEGFGTVLNLGYPINTSRDDFGLIVRNDAGYFSSNRNGEAADDNIYHFTVNRKKTLFLKVVDQSGKYLKDVKVKESFTTDKEAKTHILGAIPTEWKVIYGETAELKVCAPGYVEQVRKISKTDFFGWKNRDTLMITLAKKITSRDGKKIKLVLKDKNANILKGGQVVVTDLVSGEKKSFKMKDATPLTLMLASEKSFQLKGSLKGFQEGIVTLNESDIEKIDWNKPFDIILPDKGLFVESKFGQIVELNIRYDVNKAAIRPDAAQKLDQLAEYLRANPGIKVELGSHTDSRGAADLNQSLSQKRAESAVRYVISKGIGQERLVAVGYGKDKPKIKNAKSEKEHEQNRRTTVKIIGN